MSEEPLIPAAVPDADPNAAPPAIPPTIPPAGDAPSFVYAEGIPGAGDVPEWFKADKYASISDQAKAYKDLEGKLGSFTGAPEKYEVSLSEALTEKGISITEDDPLYAEAVKFATESNMNQDGFNQMMELYAMSKVADSEAMELHKADEIKALGQNGQERLNNLDSWAKTNLSTELYEGFVSMATSAQAVQALEKLVSMTRNAPINPAEVKPGSGTISHDDLKKMQFEKDEHGNRRLQSDKAFRAEFEKLSKELWGTEDHTTIIG